MIFKPYLLEDQAPLVCPKLTPRSLYCSSILCRLATCVLSSHFLASVLATHEALESLGNLAVPMEARAYQEAWPDLEETQVEF